MRKLFALGAITAYAIPALAFAAYNDVTFTSSAITSVGGYTLNVSGPSAVIQSIVVNTNSFSVTLASGSSITVSSPTLQKLSSDVTSDVTSNVCTGAASSISLAHSGAGTVTNVITPSATICSSSGSSSGSGGGVISGPLSVGYQPPSPVTTPTVASTPSSLGAIQANPSATTTTYVFSRNLRLWMKGTEVRQLQQYLNVHGFQVAVSGAGSPQHESTLFGTATYRALRKFQAAHAIPASGFLGPITRHFISTDPTATSTQ